MSRKKSSKKQNNGEQYAVVLFRHESGDMVSYCHISEIGELEILDLVEGNEGEALEAQRNKAKELNIKYQY